MGPPTECRLATAAATPTWRSRAPNAPPAARRLGCRRARDRHVARLQPGEAEGVEVGQSRRPEGPWVGNLETRPPTDRDFSLRQPGWLVSVDREYDLSALGVHVTVTDSRFRSRVQVGAVTSG